MHGAKLIQKYFPEITEQQHSLLSKYVDQLLQVNRSVNLISRKNEDEIWINHILHSLSIAKVVQFQSHHKVLDAGTGGGLPGIPLAILFPSTSFLLVDSIGKKVNAVQEMLDRIGLKNATTKKSRAEDLPREFDFVVSRAVTAFPKLIEIVSPLVKKGSAEGLSNGLIYIKGGDFEPELGATGKPHKIWRISEWFTEPFFETKKVVWVDVSH